LSGEKGRGKTIAIMWFMMISSIIVTAIGLSRLVDPYTPQALVRAFWIVGLSALILGVVGIFRLEGRFSEQDQTGAEGYSWGKLYRTVLENRQLRFSSGIGDLLSVILGQIS
jgi:BCD family chlorophyll transporter-like MFS transporter